VAKFTSRSEDGEGVVGETDSNTFKGGVVGRALNSSGAATGVLGQSVAGPGVVGLADRDAGVLGFHGDPKLNETTVASDGGRAGVFGASENGAGVLGYARDKASPAVFAFGGLKAIALNKPFAAEVLGDVKVVGDVLLAGADCAEQFDVKGAEHVEPGTVMVIGDNGALRSSDCAYDTRVAGIVAGAGLYRPGIVLDDQGPSLDRLSVSLMGKAFCRVDGSYGHIAVGDLLTTSSTPGHAMKASDPQRAFGAVIGKAMQPWDSAERGIIAVLIALA
jgi:hypothetical protein